MGLTIQDGWYALGLLTFLYFVVRYHCAGPDDGLRVTYARITRGGLHWRVGLVAGFVITLMNIALGGYFVAEGWRDSGHGFEKYRDVSPLIVLAYVVIVAPVFEELVYRGMGQPLAVQYLKSRWGGIIATNLFWCLMHWPGGGRAW